MKKWIVLILVFLILTITCIYIFIPAKIVISVLSKAETTTEGEYRIISQEAKWERWWRDPEGGMHVPGNPFLYNETKFHIIKTGHNAVGVELDRQKEKYQSLIYLMPIGHDSVGAIWRCEMRSTNNPFRRIMNYKNAVAIKQDLKAVIDNFSSFVSNPQNVYVFSFFTTSFRDTTLVSSRFISLSYPSTADLYSYFEVLKRNIQKQKGKTTGYPIMNIEKQENGRFETQVAIPTDRQLQNDGKIVYRRMVPGKFLCSEVRGGAYTANEALKQMNHYMEDNHKSKMANAFQMLVTDRIKEPDTLKWITKIYIPIANNDPLSK
jgi:effector-binding domain-containing protein